MPARLGRLPQKGKAEWLPSRQKQAVWHMPVKDYEDLRGDAQLSHLGAFVDTPGA